MQTIQLISKELHQVMLHESLRDFVAWNINTNLKKKVCLQPNGHKATTNSGDGYL